MAVTSQNQNEVDRADLSDWLRCSHCHALRLGEMRSVNTMSDQPSDVHAP